jgi:glycine/sarcosine N-methyltransferase
VADGDGANARWDWIGRATTQGRPYVLAPTYRRGERLNFGGIMLTNEQFYDRLARLYDTMNDWPARLAFEGPFIRRLLDEHHAGSVLDAACGTGQHALALQEWGYQATGADASQEMIRRAQANASARGLGTPFHLARFAELPDFVASSFDAVLCLGNSLPHVTTDPELEASLQGMLRVLRPGGLLLLHNLNYDRRWVERPRFMKLDSGIVDGREVLIWRLADYNESGIVFHTALFERDETGRWEVHVDSTPQKPLFSAPLQDLLRRLGCDNIRAFGSLHGEPFVASQSGDLVLACTSQAAVG